MARKSGSTAKEVARIEKAIQRVESAQSLNRETVDPDSVEGIKISNAELATVIHEENGYREPWLRLADETDRQWELFKFYRDLGPIRTTTMVATHFEVSQPTVQNMYAKKDWRARVVAFDQFEDRIYTAQRVTAIREMADRHANMVVDAITGLNKPLEILLKKLEDENFVRELELEDATALLSIARQSAKVLPTLMSAERLARGMATEIIEHQGDINVKHELDREALADVIDSLAAAGAFDQGNLGRLVSGEAGPDREIIEGEVIEFRADNSDAETEGVSPT